MLALGEETSDALQGLFGPGPALRAQARTLHDLARGFALTDRRVYSAPDERPEHALIKVKLEAAEEHAVLVLGLRLDFAGGAWIISNAPVLRRLSRTGDGKRDSLKFDIEALQAMMDGVPEFVDEMSALYRAPLTPAP